MAGRIPQDFINDLLERIDVAEVVGARLELKKAGREYKALCPFHTEKTPSFHVVPEKGFYHCFGCGEHGTALTFLLEHDRMEFREAVESLASMAGVEIPEEAVGAAPRDDRRAPLLEVVARADRWFRQQLRSHPERARAVDYLRGRGLDGETARTFGIGYAPAGYHNILPGLGGGEALRALLVEAGLLATGDGEREPYDRFRDRVIFPIRDGRGRTIAFGGRVLGDGQPKYLNSPETPLFHKGRELYGLWECRQALRSPERVLLVEGYMDVVGLAQSGIREACASLGTAATRDQMLKLLRLAPELVFCFDGDAAGRRAAWKAMDTVLDVLEDGVSVRLLFLPEGEDPDSLVRAEGQAAFRRRIGAARPCAEYLFETLAEDLDLATIDGRSRLAHRARPLVDRVPGPLMRTMMMRRLAELAKLPVDELERLFVDREAAGGSPSSVPTDASAATSGAPVDEAAGASSAAPGRSGGRPPGTPSRVRRSKEETAISLLLCRPALAARIAPERLATLAVLPGDAAGLLCSLVQRLHAEPGLAAATLIAERTGTPEHGRLIALARDAVPGAAPEAQFDEIIELLEHGADAGRARREVLYRRVRAGEASEEEVRAYLALKAAAAGVPAARDSGAGASGALKSLEGGPIKE